MGQAQAPAPPPPELVEDVAGSVTIGPQHHTLIPARAKSDAKSSLTSMFNDDKEETDDDDVKSESLGDKFRHLTFGQQKAVERALEAYRDVLNPVHLRRIKQHQWKLEGSMADFKLELWEPPVPVPGFVFLRVMPVDFVTQEWQTIHQAIVRLVSQHGAFLYLIRHCAVGRQSVHGPRPVRPAGEAAARQAVRGGAGEGLSSDHRQLQYEDLFSDNRQLQYEDLSSDH